MTGPNRIWITNKNIVWLKKNIHDDIFLKKYWDDNILDRFEREAFNGLLRDTWAKVDFKRVINNEEQALINLIHVQEGLVGGTKAITQGLR